MYEGLRDYAKGFFIHNAGGERETVTTSLNCAIFEILAYYELASTRLIKINCVFGCQKIAAGAIQHFAPLIHHLMTDNVPNLLKTKSSGKTI